MDKIIAKVGPITISESEVDEFLMGLGQRGQGYNTPEGRKIILEQLIGNKLLLLDARRNLIEAEPEFKAQLAKLKDTLLINYAAEKVVSKVQVSDKEAMEYYEANKNNFAGAETVNASHILVATEEQANELLAKIKAGEVTFEDCAKENSTCPSGQMGGNLGDFSRGQMVPEFDAAVFAMEAGEISEAPVKTQFGYHLIKLNSKNEAKVPEYAEISERLKEMLVGEKRREAYEKKINQLKIMYPVDLV